jgi:uncharacterized protein (DUF433 family)
MSDATRSVQRSFRLSPATSELLDRTTESTGETRNALADRLLGEALRTERHPLIRFRSGAAGRREPHVVGTRLLVRQIVATVRDSDGSVEEAASYLGVAPRIVRAAVSFYAEFAAEIDADSSWTHRLEADERARWEREQSAIT